MEIRRFKPGHYSFANIGSDSLDTMLIDGTAPGQVWIDAYTKHHNDPEYYSATSVATTYGWVSVDDAEAIALAILDAVSEARRREKGVKL